MSATTWHIEDGALKRYLAVAGDGAEAYSIEAHLEQCDACRGRCAVFAPTSDRAATV